MNAPSPFFQFRLPLHLKRYLPGPAWNVLRSIATSIVTPLRFSLQSGHLRSSFARRACAANGDPLPWYTYPAIDFLSARDFTGRSILEFGGGQSTLWWAKRARRVVTIEADEDWANELRAKVPANSEIHHVPVDEARRIDLVSSALGSERFDVVIIDGHLREEAIPLAFERLTPNGAVIFDNADGYGCFEGTKDRVFCRVDFFGFAPGVSLRHPTSIFFDNQCFLVSPRNPIPILSRASE